MEAAGLAIGIFGAVGALGQLLDGCLKGYKIFTTASNLGRDSEKLVYRVKIEEMRLKLWGKEWGVAEGHFEERLSRSAHHQGLKELAELILKELYRTIMDLNTLQDRYGLREEAPGSVDKEAYKRNADPNAITAPKTPGGFKLRARWVISDKDKFDTFLEDLQRYNDKLESLFPPARISTLQRALTNEMLQTAERDLSKLDALEDASRNQYPRLSTFAELKQLRINLDANEAPKKHVPSSKLKIPRYQLELDPICSSSMARFRGVYQKPLDELKGESTSESVDVFVEWTAFDACMGFEERCSIYQKVDNLSRMLHSSSNRHPDLNTLDCIGYVDDNKNNRYGMVYLILPEAEKSSPIQTLADLLANTPSPDLESRFQLAHTLAVALWSCHSLDWLHKTLCPHNILFFSLDASENAQAGRLTKPFLAGFDSSRPDHVEEMSVASKNLAGEDMYRHPDSLGPSRRKYCKSFDIYSLGLLLLEIGLWKGLDIFHKGKYSKYSPEAFREKIIQSLVPGLGSRTGSVYRNVVSQCLSYDEGATPKDESTSPYHMMGWVVQSLETLQV